MAEPLLRDVSEEAVRGWSDARGTSDTKHLPLPGTTIDPRTT